MRPLVAVTRPAPQAHETARRVEAMGCEAILAPVLREVACGALGGAAGAGSLAITSRTAARRLGEAPALSALPIFAVGAASAEEARAAGATDVRSADGTVDDLFRLLRRDAPEPVIHLAGRHHTGDLVERLRASGIGAERRVVYEMLAVDALPGVPKPVDFALLYSPRSAEIFVTLASGTAFADATPVVMSPAVAEPLQGGAVVAARPTEDALLHALSQAAAARAVGSAERALVGM